MKQFRMLVACVLVIFLSFFCGGVTLLVIYPAEKIAEVSHGLLEVIENFISYLGSWRDHGYRRGDFCVSRQKEKAK